MGCTFTKVSNMSRGHPNDSGIALSEVISNSSSFTDSQKNLEIHCSKATRDIVEKCEKAFSDLKSEEEDTLSLHMYPKYHVDADDDSTCDGSEDATDAELEAVQNIAEPSHSEQDQSSKKEARAVDSRMSRISSAMSRLSKIIPKRGKIKVKDDKAKGDENAGCYELTDVEIVQDIRIDSSSSNNSSPSPHPHKIGRIFARPMAARGTRTVTIDIANRITELEADVEKLMAVQTSPAKDFRNRILRPKAARGPRLPSFTSQFMSPREEIGGLSGTGMMFSKYFATNTVTRPQLTVKGWKTAADDCLTNWMVTQQRKDEERK